MFNPLVTVGIPTYNRPQGLRETLRRVLGQTYRHLEVIVSDNGSTDTEGVRSVLAEFSKDPRLRFHIQTRIWGPLATSIFSSTRQRKYFMLAPMMTKWNLGLLKSPCRGFCLP